MGGFAWVTLATNDSYSLGALILAHSLKQAGTSAQIAVLVTPGVTSSMKEKLSTVFNVVQEVNILDSKDEANLRLLKRPELGVTFTKLHCWRLNQYEKCVFLDADTMVLQNCDELFEREELSAAPDVGWPDCFNSGVFVFRPSQETYEKLVQFALEKGSFDGGDQGLLNLYFSDWAHKDISKHLPFIYNMCSTACYSYLPAFKQFGGNAKIIHFIGPAKPWLQYFDSESRKVSPSGGMQHLQHILQKWWDLFCEKIHPVLSREMPQRNTKHSSSIIPSRSLLSNNPEIHDFSSPDDYQNIWDPWEEYDNRQTGNVSVDFDNQNLVMDHIINTIDAQNKNNQDTHVHQEHSEHTKHTEHSSVEYTHTDHSSVEQKESNNEHIVSQESFHYHNESFHLSQVTETHNTKANIDNTPLNIQVENTSPINVTSSPDPTPIFPPSPFETTTTETNLHTSQEPDESNAGLAGAFAQLTLGAPRSAEQVALEEHLRRQGWEVGNIDYLGRDSFSNIWSKICETIAEPAPAATTTEATKEAPAAAVPVEEKAQKAPESELQSPEPIPSAEVVKEKIIEAEAPQQTEVPKEATPALEPTQQAEQVVPTTQVLPPTPTSPLGTDGCPLKAPEASPLPIPEPEVASPPPKAEPAAECPLPSKVEETKPSEAITECPMPPKTEAQPIPAKVDAAPATPTEAKVECPLPAKVEPSVCPMPPKETECPLPAKVEAEPAKPTEAKVECPLPAKVEAAPATPTEAKVECPLPAKVEAAPATPTEAKVECPLPAKVEPSVCPMPPKPEVGAPAAVEAAVCPMPPKADAPAAVEAEAAVCPMPLKAEAPAPVECSLPQPAEKPIAVCSLPPAEAEPSLAASVAEAALAEEKPAQVPVETPTVPETPKVPEPAPEAEAAGAKAPEPSSKAESTPTPPPRKGSGGPKKSPKSKK